VTAVNWDDYRKCPVCGEPCASMVAGYTTEVLTVRDRPHSTRKLRAGR
jgi:hypothetical protein